MPAKPPAFRPRPGGGFNQGMGQFGEHLDEQALQQAVSQKQLGQQQAAGTGSPQGVPTGTNPLNPAAPPAPPREVGTLFEELVKRPLVDIGKGLLSLFDFSAALGMSPPETKTPEEKARLKGMHARYQQLNKEQQTVAQQMYQEELQKKKLEKEEEERRKQLEKQKEAQTLQMPSSPNKGPIGPGGTTGKQRAVNQLNQNRQMLNAPASAN